MVRNLFMTIVAVLMFSSLSFAQLGKISGKVIDRETGDPLPGANVLVVGTTLGAATNVDGEFVILSVPTGQYSIKAGFIGYREVTVDNIRVNSGLTTEIDFELPSEALEVSEISIVAERPLVNKNATNAVRIQSYEDMKNLPVRGVEAAVALQPGIVTFSDQIYIRGGRENDVGYYLEGANVRDRDGGEIASAGGSNPVGVIPEALEEFQIQAGGFTAEFGGANAGIIQQTLKTGGPEYNFTFQYETDDFASEGDQYLDTYSYGYNDFTATFGGPVPGTDNKLRFFLAGERRTLDDYIKRFNRGYTVEHVDEDEFLAMSQAEREAAIAQLRMPIILTSDRDSTLEARLQDIGLSMPAGNVPGADREEWIGNGTLVYDAKPFIFRLGASMNWRKQDEVIPGFNRTLFNQNRIEQEEFSSALFNFKITHLIGSKSFYEVNLNYFDRREFQYDPLMGQDFWALWDSTANDEKGIQFTGRTQSWVGGSTQRMDIYGFDFDAPGSPWQSNTIKSKRNYIGGSFNFTTQLPEHEVKFGASYERWTARNFAISANTAFNYLNGVIAQPDVLRDALAGDFSAQRELSAIADNVLQNYG